jgi:hypothetical protein
MKNIYPFNYVEKAFLLLEKLQFSITIEFLSDNEINNEGYSTSYANRASEYIRNLDRKTEEEKIIQIYKEKIKPLVPIPEKYKKTTKWKTYETNKKRKEKSLPEKIRLITNIRRELDAYTIKYQSKRLLKLYLLAENIEKKLNNGKLYGEVKQKNWSNSMDTLADVVSG